MRGGPGWKLVFVFLLVVAGCGPSRQELGEIVTDLPKPHDSQARPVEIVRPADSEPGAGDPARGASEPAAPAATAPAKPSPDEAAK